LTTNNHRSNPFPPHPASNSPPESTGTVGSVQPLPSAIAVGWPDRYRESVVTTTVVWPRLMIGMALEAW
jgi:hypothetical protein